MRVALIAIAICVPAFAAADDEIDTPSDPWIDAPDDHGAPIDDVPEPVDDSPGVPDDAADAPEPPTPAELAEEIEALVDKQRQLERAQRTDAATREQVKTLLPLRRFLTVFVDVGAFAVGGDGSGIRSDIGHVHFPQYRDRVAGQWVFMGDPLSTAINSLGEPSDTAHSRQLSSDTIDSGGRPSLVVNAIGLAIGKDIGHGVAIGALAQLLPRADDNLLDIQLAQIEYRPSTEIDLAIVAGKIDSVLGIEYRTQDATRRLGVTPSLICRYTCGRPLGVGVRMTRGRLHTAATITNGDNFQQRFVPDRELESTGVPTASGHVQWMLPRLLGDSELEVGISGAIGPQDDQPETEVVQWHYGIDARARGLAGFAIAAEFVQGNQAGQTATTATDSMVMCDLAPCLTYKGAYLVIDRRVVSWFTPYARIDWRSAVHTKGTEFVYESHTLRTTVGGQFAMTSRILGKLEYTYNRELGGIPQFPDDVITSSIVVATD